MLDYIKGINTSGISNLFINYIESRVIKPSKCLSKPVFIMTEPSGNCNLKCRMCPRIAFSGNQGELDFKKWKEVMKREFRFWHMHGFAGIGEPFLNKDLPKMIKYLNNRKIYTWVVTNGTLLKEKLRNDIISSGLNRLFVSLDGASSKTQEKIRVGSNLEIIKNNLKDLVEKTKITGQGPEIIISTVCMKENVHELPDMVNLASEIGIKRIHIQDVELKFDVGLSKKNQAFRNEKNRRLFERYFKEMRERGKKLNLKVRFYNIEQYKYRKKCFIPWNQVYIRWNGDITPCATTFVAGSGCVYGNIFKENFKNIWNNIKAQKFRKAAGSLNQPTQCVNCSCL